MRRAFTLTEILVVIAVISVLVALLFPTFVHAKEVAHQTSCESNLKQIDSALQLYRSDYDGQESGNASQMGLPPYVMQSTQSLTCSSNPHRENWPYMMLWQGYVVGDPPDIWRKAVEKYQGGTPLVVDINHNDPDIPLLSPYFKRFGLVLFLDDSVRKLNRGGDFQSIDTWALSK